MQYYPLQYFASAALLHSNRGHDYREEELAVCEPFRVGIDHICDPTMKVVKIDAASSRSGVEAGLNSDDRQLAFYLKEITFHSEK